jgi:hypothetical protein
MGTGHDRLGLGFGPEDLFLDCFCELMDQPGYVRVLDQQLMLGRIILIGLCLLETRLAVLADHDERREEDGLQRDD